MYIENYRLSCQDNPDRKEAIDVQNNQLLADFIRHKLYHMKTPIERILVSPLIDSAGHHVVFIYGANYEERT